MATEEKKDSKQEEALTPSEESADEKEPTQTSEEDTSQKTEGEESSEDLLEKLKQENEKLKKKAEDFEKAFYLEKAKRREELFNFQQNLQETRPSDSQPDEYDDEVRSIVKEELQKVQEMQRQKNIKIAFEKFCKAHPEYLPENDPNDINYSRLREKANKVVLGDTVDEIYETLEFIHRAINPNQIIKPESKTEEKVEDSGVGSGSGLPKGSEKKPSALTRPLNKWEKEAAKRFPGGEKAYREALAKKEMEGK
ncbi:MAG: hypothetical protein DRP08_04140 [Candidatus Aenigmatarchaeota archaeon]|nr:MAG: hypothetical protein DRP08_04140 [Candidatus Aenigmarchaeota archaeon]